MKHAGTSRTHSPELLAKKFIAHFDAIHRKTKFSVKLALKHGLCFRNVKTNETIPIKTFIAKIFSEHVVNARQWELVNPVPYAQNQTRVN